MAAQARGSAPRYGPPLALAPAAKRGMPTGAILAIVGGGLAVVLVAVVAGFLVVGDDTTNVTVPGVDISVATIPVSAVSAVVKL